MRFNDAYLQLGFQGVKDTAAANPLWYLRLLSGTSIGPDRDIQVKRTAEAGRASDGIAVPGQMGSGGTVQFVTQFDNTAAMLAAALGAVASSGGAGEYTHDVTPEQTDELPWLTGWLKIDTIRMKLVNLKVNSLKLVVSSADRLVVGQMELMGAGAVTYQTADPGSPASAEDIDEYFSWDMAASAWTLDSSSVGYIHTFEFDVMNNLVGIPGEDLQFYDIQEGPQDLQYAATITIIDAGEYNTQIFGSASPSADTEASAAILSGDFNVKFTAAASPERSLEIDVTESQYRNPFPKLNVDPDGAPQDLRLEARCVGTDPKVTATVVNDVASYDIGS